MTTELQFRDRLQHTAQRIEVGDTPIAAVVARGRQRTQRRRTAVGALTALGIVAGGVATFGAFDRPGTPGRVVAGTGGTSDVGDGTVPDTAPLDTAPADEVTVPPVVVPPTGFTEVPSSLDWTRTDLIATAPIGALFSGVVGDGPYFAWVQPGDAGLSLQLQRSDDGIAWTTVTQPPIDGSVVLAARGSTVVTYGTEAGGAPVSAVSLDAGATWTTAPLPIDLSVLTADPLVDAGASTAYAVSIAAGPAGVVMAVQMSPSLVWDAVVPGGAQQQFSVTTTGIDLPSRSYTWAELGVQPATAAMFERPLRWFLATDGQDFTEIAAPPTGVSGNTGITMSADDAGFLAVVSTALDTGPVVNELWQSADGVSWVDLGPVPVSYTATVGSLGGSILVIGSNESGGEVAVRASDGTWIAQDFGDVVTAAGGSPATASLGGASIGPDGAMLQLTAFPDQADNGMVNPGTAVPIVLHSLDGYAWSHEDLSVLAGEPVAVDGAVGVFGSRVVVTLVPRDASDVTTEPHFVLTGTIRS